MEGQDIFQDVQVQAPTPISLVEQNKPRLKSKVRIALPITIVILSVIVGLITYYYLGILKIKPQSQKNPVVTSQTPQPTYVTFDETANWKTLINTDYGFSIDYPKDWNAFSVDIGQINYFKEPGSESGYGSSFIDIRPSDKVLDSHIPLSKNTLDGYISYLEKNDYDRTTQVVKNITKINTKDDIIGYFVEWVPDGSFGPAQKRYTTFFQSPFNSNSIIEIGGRQDQYLDVYNQMIKTFKFLDKNQIVSSCIGEKSQILAVVDEFEKLQKQKDALKALDLFTPSSNLLDDDTYNFFTGKKTGTIGLYGNVTTNFNELSYKIVTDPILDNNSKSSCIVSVEEQRSYYLNAEPVGYAPASTYKASFDLQNDEQGWKIINYYPSDYTPGSNHRLKKFSAWGY